MATPSARPNPWAVFGSTLTRFDKQKILPDIAIRNAAGFLAAYIVATAIWGPASGAAAATGALNVSFSDSRDPYAIRGRRMFQAALLCTCAVFLGTLSGHNSVAAVITATAWAFGAGMMVCLGPIPGDLGVITLVTLVVFAARPLDPLHAAQTALLVLGGSGIQTLIAIAPWPIQRYEPERRIVSSLYVALAQVARNPTPPQFAPPVSGQISDAQDALLSLSGDHAPEAERHIFLLNQAERIRLSLLTLGRSYRRLNREARGQEAAAALQPLFSAAAQVLEKIGHCSSIGKPAGNTDHFATAAQNFRATDWGGGTTFFAALIRDTRAQIDALGGQLRAATASALPDQPGMTLLATERNEPLRLRFRSRLERLQANLSLQSTVFRHALRLAVCIGVGDALGRGLSLQRTYWIPMTIAIVLKPDFTATLSRSILRILGTFAGLLLATGLFHFLHTGFATDIALLGVSVFLLRWIGPGNYGLFVASLSAMVVLLLATTGVAPAEVIVARAENSVAGGLLAMVAWIAWPTWERTLAGNSLACMVEAYRTYFRAVMGAYAGDPQEPIDRARIAARRARSNVEASSDRMSAEPGIPAAIRRTLNAILANSHGFVHAVMSLEAGLYQTRPAPPRPATIRFREKVVQTLDVIARGLRTESAPKGLPDLREAHSEILSSAEPSTARYALVNIETDRIVTTLNTVAEQTARWAKASRHFKEFKSGH
jgi:uncharacterized membrane protein YccC